jgi:hypothetical protein
VVLANSISSCTGEKSEAKETSSPLPHVIDCSAFGFGFEKIEIPGFSAFHNANHLTLIICDTCIVHDFHGSTADVAQHGGLRHQDPNRVLTRFGGSEENDAAVKRIEGNGYRQAKLAESKQSLFAFDYVNVWSSRHLVMSLVMRNCVSVVVLSSFSIVPSSALLALKRSHFAWVATRRHSPTTRANAKPRLMCLPSTMRLDLIGWTWTISLLIFPRNKLLFEAFYAWVLCLCLCVCVSMG